MTFPQSLIQFLGERGSRFVHGEGLRVGRVNEILESDSGLLSEDMLDSWWASVLAIAPSGWAQFSDCNVWIDRGRVSTQSLQSGLLLAAELCADEVTYNLRVAPREDGRRRLEWVATKIERIVEPDSFLEEAWLASKQPSVSYLRYEVAWQANRRAQGAFAPVASRLAGTGAAATT